VDGGGRNGSEGWVWEAGGKAPDQRGRRGSTGRGKNGDGEWDRVIVSQGVWRRWVVSLTGREGTDEDREKSFQRVQENDEGN